MNPLYFGEATRQLFGVYEPPRGAVSSGHGVVLCHPAPQEYMRAHWAMRRLARELSSTGHHVLRFDYYGTGDSAGAGDAGGLEAWQTDIDAAVRELMDVGGVTKVSLVGLRLGATLALGAAATAGVRLRDLVLWEPVVSGGHYLEELEDAAMRHAARLLFHEHERSDELLGAPMTAAMRAALRALDLTSVVAPRAERVHVFFAEPRPVYTALSAKLATLGGRAALRHIPEAAASRHAADGALLATNMIKAIVATLAETSAHA